MKFNENQDEHHKSTNDSEETKGSYQIVLD